MLTHFPQAVPEIPVSNVDKAAEYYVNVLGFHFDWGNDEGGIGGISQGECRMFLTNTPFCQSYGNGGIVVVWLNLNSKQERTVPSLAGGRGENPCRAGGQTLAPARVQSRRSGRESVARVL